MMTQPLSEQGQFQEQFQNQLQRLYTQILEADKLRPVRTKAWDHFLELGLPTRKSEAFRYLKLHHLFSHSYDLPKPKAVLPEAIAPYIFPECSSSVLVFVNGYFNLSLSRLDGLPKRVVVSNLQEAMKTYGAFLHNQWARSLKEETDPFAALNAAMHPEGGFLYLPPKTVVEVPVQILHVIDMPGESGLALPRLHLFAGSQSQISLYTSQAILFGNSYFVNAAIECAIEEDSHVRYIQTAFDEPEDAWHFEAFRGNLKRNSTLKTVSITDGGPGVRFDYRVALSGSNAEALLNGAWFLKGKAESHTHVIMDHQAPACRSMQLYKGVLDESSHSSFEGKILVRQAAQKTEAFQTNHNLLLSDNAAAESKPNLEIFADDVKASHGATIGQLDKDQLFYMKTRGFSLKEAQNILVQGFCKEVIDQVSLPSLFNTINQRTESYLGKA